MSVDTAQGRVMTVAELRERLAEYPDYYPVVPVVLTGVGDVDRPRRGRTTETPELAERRGAMVETRLGILQVGTSTSGTPVTTPAVFVGQLRDSPTDYRHYHPAPVETP